MKRVILAWIEQKIEFDSEMEYAAFEHDLATGRKKYRIIDTEKHKDGKFRVHLIRQYNNNEFPEGGAADVQR